MEQANIPQQAELNALYGSWNPGAYMRGYENQGLADQFREQAFGANQQSIAKTQQEYDQNALMNPLRVDALKGTNAGQEIANTTNGVASRRAVANEGANLSEDLRAHALKMTDDEFKKADQHIESLLRSQNPSEQKLGLQLQATLPSMLAEKRKNDAAMALQQEQSRSHIEGARIQAKGMLDTEQARIAAGKYDKAKGAVTSIWEQLASGKLSNENAAVKLKAYELAAKTPEEKELYRDAAVQFALEARRLKNNMVGKPDMEALGLETTKDTNPYGAPAPARTPQDDEAYNWAMANLTDPRAAKILQKLGK